MVAGPLLERDRLELFRIPWVLEEGTWVDRTRSFLCIEVLPVAMSRRKPSLIRLILNLLESSAACKIVISNELLAEHLYTYLERFYYVIKVRVAVLAVKRVIEV